MNSVKELKQILEKERPHKIFLVVDQAFEKSGAKEKFAPFLQQYQVKVFSHILPNPSLEQIKQGIDVFRKSSPDFILAVGGGSVIDTAKAVNVLAAQEGEPVSYIKREKEIKAPGKPLLAIPTTAGTGSEATHFAALYIDKIKYSLTHNFLKPALAIIDPELTYSMPPKLTAVTGMDALAQAIESFWSVKATQQSKQYSKEAIQLILPNLVPAVENPAPASREAMLKGAHLSGKAINIAQTTACHALSYPFTSHYGIPHGHAVALTLPEMILYNGKALEKEKFAELLSLLSAKSVEEAADSIRGLMKKIGLKTKLRDIGITNLQEIQKLIIKEVNIERLSNNPGELTKGDIRAILKSIF